MSERQDSRYDNIARKWLALAERREADFIDMLESGRWRRYFGERELREEGYKIARARDHWARIVALLLGERPSAVKPEELPCADGGADGGVAKPRSQA
jgi:hypothetical protein